MAPRSCSRGRPAARRPPAPPGPAPQLGAAVGLRRLSGARRRASPRRPAGRLPRPAASPRAHGRSRVTAARTRRRAVRRAAAPCATRSDHRGRAEVRTHAATRGDWNRTPGATASSGSRNETEIGGATRQTYRLGVADVGQRIKARSTSRSAYTWAQATARSDGAGRLPRPRPSQRHLPHRDARPGSPPACGSSPKQAAQTYADPRGWRNAGVAFRRVRGASDFSWCWPRRGGCRASPACAACSGAAGRAATWSSTRRAGSTPHRRGTRRQEPARLPPHGGQPRDRPLARPRPPRLPPARPPRAGDDAAVQGCSTAAVTTPGRRGRMSGPASRSEGTSRSWA